MSSREYSLSFLVAVLSATVIAAGMGIYAVWQYLALPGKTVEELALEHLWHVVVLGALVYLVGWVVFRRLVLAPIRRISAHLYGIGTGRVERLELESRIRELRRIADGVNQMVWRLEHAPEGELQARIGPAFDALKERVGYLLADRPQDAQDLLVEVGKLEAEAFRSMVGQRQRAGELGDLPGGRVPV